MGSVGLVLRLITSVILITAAVLAREAPTAFVILLTLSVGNLVLTIAQYRRQHPGPG